MCQQFFMYTRMNFEYFRSFEVNKLKLKKENSKLKMRKSRHSKGQYKYQLEVK